MSLRPTAGQPYYFTKTGELTPQTAHSSDIFKKSLKVRYGSHTFAKDVRRTTRCAAFRWTCTSSPPMNGEVIKQLFMGSSENIQQRQWKVYPNWSPKLAHRRWKSQLKPPQSLQEISPGIWNTCSKFMFTFSCLFTVYKLCRKKRERCTRMWLVSNYKSIEQCTAKLTSKSVKDYSCTVHILIWKDACNL